MLLQNYINKSYRFLCLSFTICLPLSLYHLFYVCLKKACNREVLQLTLKKFKGEGKLFNNSHKREILENNGIVWFEKKLMDLLAGVLHFVISFFMLLVLTYETKVSTIFFLDLCMRGNEIAILILVIRAWFTPIFLTFKFGVIY